MTKFSLQEYTGKWPSWVDPPEGINSNDHQKQPSPEGTSTRIPGITTTNIQAPALRRNINLA